MLSPIARLPREEWGEEETPGAGASSAASSWSLAPSSPPVVIANSFSAIAFQLQQSCAEEISYFLRSR